MLNNYIKVYVNAYTRTFKHPMSDYPFMWGFQCQGMLNRVQEEACIKTAEWLAANMLPDYRIGWDEDTNPHPFLFPHEEGYNEALEMKRWDTYSDYIAEGGWSSDGPVEGVDSHAYYGPMTTLTNYIEAQRDRMFD